jgi:hypothetical protein
MRSIKENNEMYQYFRIEEYMVIYIGPNVRRVWENIIKAIKLVVTRRA